jgi:hypothetical protein
VRSRVATLPFLAPYLNQLPLGQSEVEFTLPRSATLACSTTWVSPSLPCRARSPAAVSQRAFSSSRISMTKPEPLVLPSSWSVGLDSTSICDQLTFNPLQPSLTQKLRNIGKGDAQGLEPWTR